LARCSHGWPITRTIDLLHRQGKRPAHERAITKPQNTLTPISLAVRFPCQSELGAAWKSRTQELICCGQIVARLRTEQNEAHEMRGADISRNTQKKACDITNHRTRTAETRRKSRNNDGHVRLQDTDAAPITAFGFFRSRELQSPLRLKVLCFRARYSRSADLWLRSQGFRKQEGARIASAHHAGHYADSCSFILDCCIARVFWQEIALPSFPLSGDQD